jgi:hypothetical protein
LVTRVLDKASTSYNDTFDAFRLSMRYYELGYWQLYWNILMKDLDAAYTAARFANIAAATSQSTIFPTEIFSIVEAERGDG